MKITSVSGVPVSGGPTIDCTTAIALNDWVRHRVMQAVGRTPAAGSPRPEQRIALFCRSRNNVRGAKLSRTSFGHAIDVSGVTLKDGTTLTVLDHWRSGKYGSVIKAMHSSACGTFGTVLGPNADRHHQNHLHLDTARYRSGSLLPLGGDQVGSILPGFRGREGAPVARLCLCPSSGRRAALAPKRPPVHTGVDGFRVGAGAADGRIPAEVPIHARLAPGGPAGFRKRNHSVSL
ncbi:MAG: extensin family protein [Paracoccaceae bacterium]